MICVNPQGSGKWACGRCPACRINRKRDWVSRMMLEAAASKAAFFITLTYRLVQFNEKGVPTLDPEHVRNWLKRFRKLYSSRTVRFFLCGEYGSKTLRPHYHVILFFSEWSLQYEREFLDNVQGTWTLGHVHSGSVTSASLQYVLGYLLKASTFRHSMPDGRHKEFARFSKGIGSPAIEELVRVSQKLSFTYRVEGREYVMPKYIRKKVRDDYGLVCQKAPADNEIAEMHIMWESTRNPEIMENLRKLQTVRNEKNSLSRQRTLNREKQGLLERKKNETL